MTGGGEAVLFWVLAPIMVVAALGLLFARKAVHAALSMAVVMVLLGVIYLAEQADFLGVVQVFVYTGAVMMLFLFVLMLVGVDHADSIVETIKGQRFWSVVAAIGLGGLLVTAIGSINLPDFKGLDQTNASPGNVTALAYLIFGKYVLAFEVTSALLITAALGAMVLAHRERVNRKITQGELAARRVRRNVNVAGLPAPGVFARNNAIDTPALLPDGTPSALSVNRVLVAREQVASPETFTHAEDDIEHEISEGSAR